MLARSQAPAPAPGEIILHHATRSFRVQADQAGTLRGRLRRGPAGGPPPVPALHDVSLQIASGETVGMVGRNGAGKTSTLKILAGIIPLDSGRAACGGRVVSLLELGAGFSRDFSGRENILLQGALFGFDRPGIEARMDDIVAFSELGAFVEAPIRTYSQGMLLRLSFSIAAHLDADVLLIDEVLAVGDEAFQRKCLRRIAEQIAAGATLLLVSHELGSIERVCTRVVVLDHGRVSFDGATADGLAHYRSLLGVEHGGGELIRGHGRRGGPQAPPVEVVDVEIRDAAGRPTSVVGAGQPLALHLGLRAAGPAQRARVEVAFRAASGPLLARTVTHAELDASGHATILYEIPELPLLAGDYDVVVGAGPTPSDAETAQRTVRFSVPDGAPEGGIDLQGRWRAQTASVLARSPGGEREGPGAPR